MLVQTKINGVDEMGKNIKRKERRFFNEDNIDVKVFILKNKLKQLKGVRKLITNEIEKAKEEMKAYTGK